MATPGIKGIPRLISGLCDNALLEGSLRKQESIEEPLIYEVAKDLTLGHEAAGLRPTLRFHRLFQH